jgi:hypothetical protein
MVSANKFALEDYDTEERKALLPSGSGEPGNAEEIEDKDGWSSGRITLTALVLIILLITGAFTVLVLGGTLCRKRLPAVSSILRSNGTHDFKPTVLMVSIDGLRCVLLRQKWSRLSYHYNRADYLDRGLTPHLLALSKKGIRAKSMKPVFPVCWHLLSFLVGSLTTLYADPDFPVSLLHKPNLTE